MAAIQIIVRGRVQGVGFRYFVNQAGREAAISGEVWNRSDGGVEVHAEHDNPAVLQEFALALRNGPGHVREVHVERNEERSCIGFRIGSTR